MSEPASSKRFLLHAYTALKEDIINACLHADLNVWPCVYIQLSKSVPQQ